MKKLGKAGTSFTIAAALALAGAGAASAGAGATGYQPCGTAKGSITVLSDYVTTLGAQPPGGTYKMFDNVTFVFRTAPVPGGGTWKATTQSTPWSWGPACGG